MLNYATHNGPEEIHVHEIWLDGTVVQWQPVCLQSVATMHDCWSVHCSDLSPCRQGQHYMKAHYTCVKN